MIVRKSILLLFFSCLLFGFIAVFLGKELSWDLAGYHYYNPYAWLHHRYGLDVWPASNIQTFFNPMLDLLTYFLIYFFSPVYAIFIMGALHGLNAWLAFMIARIFFPKKDNIHLFKVIVITFIGCYGPITLPEIGSFQGDLTISSLVLAAIWLQLLAINQYSKKIIVMSGLLLGAATGLKLTAGFYIIGMGISLFFMPISTRHKLQWLTFWMFGALIGFLIFYGPWMFHLWQTYHNPFFPFFNKIFHSTDFVFSNWRDTRFLPKNLGQAIFFPFYFSWNGQTADLQFIDFRFAVIWILLFIFNMKLIIKKIKHQIININPIFVWLILFFISSYILWEMCFSIMRYLVSLEILAPLLIYLLLEKIIDNANFRNPITVILFCFIVLSMRPMSTDERLQKLGNHYLNIKIPSAVLQEKNAVTLIAYSDKVQHPIPYPQTYLIPFFPSSWRFVGIPINLNRYELPKQLNDLMTSAPDHFYLLTTKHTMPILYRAAHQLGLVATAGKCQMITSDRQQLNFLQQEPVLLCPVVRKKISR